MDRDKEKEFEAAIVHYGGIITKICYYFSTNADEYKDLRQEVVCNIWKGWDQFRKDSKLSTWIYRVSFNTCISFQRKERKNRETISIENIADLPDTSDNSLQEKYRLMHSLIGRLGFRDRAIILMWLDEKSYDEISELMGMNRNTIAVRLKRIKEKLSVMASK